MSVVGLITEYNPFHNGHLYHIQEAKRISGADSVVVIMSGNFVQRGTVAIIDKYTRTQMALMAGSDLVIELPVCYACASAESFALGAVSILDRLGFVDSLVFGSEHGSIPLLKEIATLYRNEPAEVTAFIQELLRTGLTYPAARSKAYLSYLRNNKGFIDRYPAIDLETVINSPNNILGIEYIKALQELGSKIQPLTIERIQADFHSEDLTGQINSATAIRKALINPLNHQSQSTEQVSQPLKQVPQSLEQIRDSVPDFAYKLLSECYGKTYPILSEDTNLLLKYRLLTEDINQLSQYLDVTTDLANRMKNLKLDGHSFEELVGDIKSRQYTQTRIQRAFTHILLGIKTEAFARYKKNGCTPYARVLGLRKSASHLLRRVNTDEIEVITKLSKAYLPEYGQEMLELDIRATHLYNLIIAKKYGTLCKDEYTHGMILI